MPVTSCETPTSKYGSAGKSTHLPTHGGIGGGTDSARPDHAGATTGPDRAAPRRRFPVALEAG